jgi:hypothetical protein
MTVSRRIRNSKRSFLGGGMGVLIPIGTRQKNASRESLKTEDSSSQSAIPSEWIEQIGQEAREQMGYQPETEKSDSTTGQESEY